MSGTQTRFDMPTNEGSLALAMAVATGSKLRIRGAVLCRTGNMWTSVTSVAGATWTIISSKVVSDIIPCTCYLPELVDIQGSVDGPAVCALEMEFTFMPTEALSYDTVAVLADLYYAFAQFSMGNSYVVGSTVWCLVDDSYVFYRCIAAVASTTIPPVNDTEHWEEVHVEDQLAYSDPSVGGVPYVAVSDSGIPVGTKFYSLSTEPIVLYISKASNLISVSDHIEVDYKVRIYVDGVRDASSSKFPIAFDTLGPEFMGSAQLNLLAAFAQQLRMVRDVAVAKAGSEGV